MTKKRYSVNINQRVWGVISKDYGLRRDIRRKIINIRALAKYIIDTYDLDAGLDAVISAIRRWETEEKIAEQAELVEKTFKKCSVFTKDHISCITIKSRAFPDFVKNIKEIPGNFRLINSKKMTKIVINQDDIETVKDFFTPEHIIRIDEDLGELRLVFTDVPHEIVGLLAKITGELAVNDIALIECIVCFPEFLIYVDKKDLLNAHKTILELQG